MNKLLKLNRQKFLQQNIYNLNYIENVFCHPSWVGESRIDIQTKIMPDINNKFLVFLSQPLKQFYIILDLVILNLLFLDKSLKLRGNYLLLLQNKFGKNKLMEAINNSNFLLDTISINFKSFNLGDEYFYLQSRYILTKILYKNKNITLRNRVVYRFDKNIKVNNDINSLWDLVSINLIESTAMLILKQLLCNYFR
jgi:hypothetical protein